MAPEEQHLRLFWMSTSMYTHEHEHLYTRFMSTIKPYSVLDWLQSHTSPADCISCLHQEAPLRHCLVPLTLYKHTL